MPLHIGIVGCSSEGAALCYRTICEEGANKLGPYAHPEVSLHTHSLAKYVNCMVNGDSAGVADLMISSANKLAAAGADFLICPDNTVHQAFSLVKSKSPLPWLHIAEVVVKEAAERQLHKVGITGTQWLMSSSVYPDVINDNGLNFMLPLDEERLQMNRIILEELIHGICRSESILYFQNVISNLKMRGCDSVILGCTEIPLIINDQNSPLPTLDSTRLLARAALQKAIVE